MTIPSADWIKTYMREFSFMDTVELTQFLNEKFYYGKTDIFWEESDLWNALAKGDRAEAKADAA